MIFLQKMPGISEMHLCVQTIRTCKRHEVFGRSAVMELLELKGSGASKLLSNLVKADIIEPVSGHGKGKYKFKK